LLAGNQQSVVAVVDDDPRVRESLQDLLASAGIETRLFQSAEEILQNNGLETAGCLITDVRMSGIDGSELHRLALAEFPNLPIIFITAHHDEKIHQKALSMGAFAFLHKPFDGEKLLSAVGAALLHKNVGGKGASYSSSDPGANE
jgi:FixJ family two-component response regulator